MKALVYPTWDTLEIRQVPAPTPGPGEVVLRVAAVGICGSELEAVASRSPRRTPPLVMGHEFCGEVAEVGAGVWEAKAGDRVVASSIIPCGRCADCRSGATHLCPDRQVFGMNRPGAFAERVAVPASILLPLPERVGPLEGALVEPRRRPTTRRPSSCPSRADPGDLGRHRYFTSTWPFIAGCRPQM